MTSLDTNATQEIPKLTKRELEILGLVFQGMMAKEIADKLFLSYETVEKHKTHAYKKLGVHNSVQAFREATILGIIEPSKAGVK